MNILVLVILLFTAACLLFGALFGMIRGRNRSILRLVLVIGCGVAALLLKDMIAGIILDTEMGKEITSGITEGLGEIEALSSILAAFVRIMLGFVVYLLLFFVLQFVSWMILYPICKIFVKKDGLRKAKKEAALNPQENQGKVKIKGKKKRGIGSLIGLGQGLVVAFFICAPLTGFIFQAYDVLLPVKDLMASLDDAEESAFVEEELESVSQYNATIESPVVDNYSSDIGGSSSSSSDDTEALNKIIDLLGGFVESAPAKIFNSVGGWYADIVTTDKETGISLENITEVMKTTTTVATEITNFMDILSGFDGDNGPDADDMRKIGNSLVKIGNAIDAMSEDGTKIMNDLLGGVKDLISDTADGDDAQKIEDLFNEIKVADLKLAPAGNAIVALADYAEDKIMTQDKANKIINGIAQNRFVIDLVGETELEDMSDSADRVFFENAIAQQSPDIQHDLKVMFGLA